MTTNESNRARAEQMLERIRDLRSRAELIPSKDAEVCFEIITIMNKACSLLYSRPSTSLENYYSIVKKPMWLEKIKEKVEKCSSSYSIQSFIADVRLIFDNFYLFNMETQNNVKTVRQLEVEVEKILVEKLREPETLVKDIVKLANRLKNEDKEILKQIYCRYSGTLYNRNTPVNVKLDTASAALKRRFLLELQKIPEGSRGAATVKAAAKMTGESNATAGARKDEMKKTFEGMGKDGLHNYSAPTAVVDALPQNKHTQGFVEAPEMIAYSSGSGDDSE